VSQDNQAGDDQEIYIRPQLAIAGWLVPGGVVVVVGPPATYIIHGQLVAGFLLTEEEEGVEEQNRGSSMSTAKVHFLFLIHVLPIILSFSLFFPFAAAASCMMQDKSKRRFWF
jgi:hypothetical protein